MAAIRQPGGRAAPRKSPLGERPWGPTVAEQFAEILVAAGMKRINVVDLPRFRGRVGIWLQAI
jgi:hypothetical protein